MTKKTDFSIVLPTYSGVNTIHHTFDSLLAQKTSQKYEIIILVDGPNRELREIVDTAADIFQEKGIQTKVKQFEKNKGRFLARLEAAKLATAQQLLFIDDRIELDRGYLGELLKNTSLVSMPNVIEIQENKRPISLMLRSVRKKLYSKRWGEEFDDYYVNENNFESSPKGAAALWIPKNLFIEACETVLRSKEGSGRYTNEDTRVLKYVVSAGYPILKTSRLRIFYRPRAALKEEIRHLYERGPRFIDYYLRPRTRFFIPLMIFYLSLILGIALLVLAPSIFLVGAFVSILGITLFALYLSGFTIDTLFVFVGLILALCVFGAGLIKGTFLKLVGRI